MAAVIVRCRVAGRDVDQAERIVGAEDAPRIRRAARVRLPFRRCGQHVGTSEIPGPEQASADRIEAAHDAGRFLRFDVVCDPAAEHCNAVCERRWRRHVVEARFHVAHAVEQRDFAVAAEVAAALARLRVDCDQARVGRGGENSLRTIGGRLGRLEIRHAATRRGEADFRVLQLRIEAPAFGARVRIERRDDVARETDIERVTDLQRRCLECAADARAIGPRDLQLVDIRCVDLIEGHIARAGRGSAPVLPIACGNFRTAGARRKRQRWIWLAHRDRDADRREPHDSNPADRRREQRTLN